MDRIDFLIDRLGLLPHPEGGLFKEVYRCDEAVSDLDKRFFGKERNISTSIYYMLKSGDISKFHRIKSDEIWHHYEGDLINLYVIESGQLRIERLGSVSDCSVPQVLVRYGAWFAAETVGDTGFTLAGCTVAPGFDFEDFEMAEGEKLLDEYPEFSEVIKKFT